MKRQLDANVHVRDPASGLIFCIRMPRQHKSIGSIAQKVYKRACPNGTGGRGNNSPIAAQQLSTTTCLPLFFHKNSKNITFA